MAGKPRKPETRAAAKSPALTVLLTGAVCLSAGLAIGYYFGRQAAPDAAPVRAEGPPPNAPASPAAMDPNAFMQEESRLRAAAAVNPRDAAALVRLGNLYYDSGRFRDAIDWYGRALEINPADPNVRTDRGTSYWSIGDADSALAEFQKSLAVRPNHPQTLYNLGVVQLHGKNSPSAARKAWEQLLATNPDYPERSKLQEQIAELAVEQPPPATGARELLERLKKRP